MGQGLTLAHLHVCMSPTVCAFADIGIAVNPLHYSSLSYLRYT